MLNLAATLETFEFVFSGTDNAPGNNFGFDTEEIVETLQESMRGSRYYVSAIRGQNISLRYGPIEEDGKRDGWQLTIKNKTYLAPGFKNSPDWGAIKRILEEHGFSRR